MKTIYLSGPMRGHEDCNYPLFNKRAKELRELGFTVFNPAENFGGDQSRDFKEYMREDFQMVCKSDTIALLPGWQKSEGATGEYTVAKMIGLEAIDAMTLQIINKGPEVEKSMKNGSEPVLESGLKDSGERRKFMTGSVRDASTGKGRPSLLPIMALIEVSKHFEKGAIKYDERNWELGQPYSSYYDSAQRHLMKFWGGATDEDHLTAYAWNALCQLDTFLRVKKGMLPEELDDRPDVLFDENGE